VLDRIRAAEQLVSALIGGRDGADWQVVCNVVADEHDAMDVRRAALHALAQTGVAALAQLLRTYSGDTARVLRKDAVALLRNVRVPPDMEGRLEGQVGKLKGPERLAVLEHLASTFGGDPRVVHAYLTALQDDDHHIRLQAVRGLALLGEMAGVMAAMGDSCVVVRLRAVEMLGSFSTLHDHEIRALGRGLHDADGRVRRAAKTALRNLGIQPMAAPPSKARRPGKAPAPD
jgi:HEAT repeat protein